MIFPKDLQELKNYVQQQSKGKKGLYIKGGWGEWHFLETALNLKNAVQDTAKYLADDILREPSNASFSNPYSVTQKINAIYIGNSTILSKLTNSWRHPDELEINNIEDGTYLYAWAAVARLFPISEKINYQNRFVTREEELAFQPPGVSTILWEEVSTYLQETSSDDEYEQLRECSQYLIQNKEITREDLQTAPGEHLRLLRKQPYLLNNSARDYLVEQVYLRLFDFDYQDEIALSVELLKANKDKRIQNIFRYLVQNCANSSPFNWGKVAAVLFSDNWCIY